MRKYQKGRFLIRTTLRLKKGHFSEAGKGRPSRRRPVTGSRLGMGKPAREAVGLSEKLGVDLLVVGSGRHRAARHALSATARRAVLGSAADSRQANIGYEIAPGYWGEG